MKSQINEVWQKITECLKQNLTDPGFQTFLSSVKPISFSNQVLLVEFPNVFSKEWFREKCEPILQPFLQETFQETLMFQYQVAESKPTGYDQISIFDPPKPNIPNQQEKSQDEENQKYNFDNFIVGHNNRFAHAASEAVSKAPAKAYNPLFIYGSSGLGKTHLLHGIEDKVKQLHPQLKTKFVSSEKFTNDLINSIKDKTVQAFRAQYRSVDVLLIDDIQFLAGKEQTQEEFFHTFNDLHSNNKQIVIASDRPPKEIPTLEIRLRTRFEWGLIADIQAPEFETRIAILRKKSEDNNFNIPDDILHFIATQIPTNVREMEGALTRVVAYAALLNTDVTLSIASNVIQDMVGTKQEAPMSISHIKRKVCDYFSISEDELCSKIRTKEIAFARQIAMYLTRELTNISLPKIGESFGKRDHSTVMHACDRIKKSMISDPETHNTVKVLMSNIKNNQ